MTQIPKNQLYNRWDLLPDSLREAIASETNSSIVWKTGEAEHLPKEKLMVVSRLAGFVLMGFIHPEDLAVEISDELGIDKRIAANIANPINKKIFQPLRDELEKIYAPATEEAELPKPTMVEEIIKPKAGSTNSLQAGIPTPPPVKMGDLKAPEKSTGVPAFFQTGQIPKPVAPSPIPIPKPAMQSAQPSPVGIKNESPAPFILHQEMESQPLAPSRSGFKVGLSQEQFGKMEQKWAAPPRPAQIETSFVYSEPSRTIPKPETRTVHYNEMRTPVPPVPSDGSINLTINKNTMRPSPSRPEIPKQSPPRPPEPPAASAKAPQPLPNIAVTPAGAQAQPQINRLEPIVVTKPKDMLPGKPEELDLPAPKPNAIQ